LGHRVDLKSICSTLYAFRQQTIVHRVGLLCDRFQVIDATNGYALSTS